MTKKVEKKVNKCIENLVDATLFLIDKIPDDGFFKDPCASLEKLSKVVVELAGLSGVGESEGVAETGVILLPQPMGESALPKKTDKSGDTELIL